MARLQQRLSTVRLKLSNHARLACCALWTLTGMSKSLLKRIGVSGYNKPKRTPSHPTKSHVVVAKEGDKVKTIRFGQQGVSGSPKKEGESDAARKRRESFKARHRRNIAKGRMSAAFWSNKQKW